MYVSDHYNNRIQKLDINGNFLAKWGSQGTGDGQFNYPGGIAVDANNNVYIADNSNNRIQKFDANGNFLTKWGMQGTENGQFKSPNDIAVDVNGNILVSDGDNNRIQKFDANGNFLTKWGILGANDGEMEGPDGLAVDASGAIYVVDVYNHRIQKFTADGVYLSQFGSLGTNAGQFTYPGGIAIGPSGNIYVADTNNDRIQKFDANGTYIGMWGAQGFGNSQFRYPTSISSDINENIYVTDRFNHRIQIFSYPLQNTTVIPANAETGQPIVVNTPENTTITCSDSATEASQAVQDAEYDYPMGLTEFCFDTLSSSNTVSLTFITDLTPAQIVARKYNPITQTYLALPEATITQTTYDGQPALNLTYTIVDNGELDVDQAVGKIKDPIGFSIIAAAETSPVATENNTATANGTQTSSSSPQAKNSLSAAQPLANTGQNVVNILSLSALTIVFSALGYAVLNRRR